jgi:hypothetical protein
VGKDDLNAFPTVVFEVGFSQSLEDVSEAAARIIGGSAGAVLLVVAIKLEYRQLIDGVRAPLKEAHAHYWMLTGMEELREKPKGSFKRPILIESDDFGPKLFHFFLDQGPKGNSPVSQLTISRTESYPVSTHASNMTHTNYWMLMGLFPDFF